MFFRWFLPILSPSSCPHCPHCCARPHSAPAQSSHLANPKCLNMDVRPLTRALRRFRGCHVPAGPVRRAPSRCARPAIEVTIARCDNTSSWEGVQFPQLGGRPTTIDHDAGRNHAAAPPPIAADNARGTAPRAGKRIGAIASIINPADEIVGVRRRDAWQYSRVGSGSAVSTKTLVASIKVDFARARAW